MPGEEVFVFPASFAQQRLWFLDQFDPGSPFYNIPNAVRLAGRLDVSVLTRALNEIIRRHESLRTTFTAMDGQPVQVIHPELLIEIPIIDLSNDGKGQNKPPENILTDQEQFNTAINLANEEARKPFDLSKGPLLRVSLIRFSDIENIILLTMHHIISDGWSMGVLIYELTTIYRSFSVNQPSPLPELQIQYADYSEWQRGWLQGEVLDKQLSYWQKKLGDIPAILELPSDRPRPAVLTSRGDSFDTTFSKQFQESLKAFSQRYGATLFMTLLAGFNALLYRYVGQEDIAVGSPIANRQQVELESLIGVFINTVVFRTDVSGEPSFRELIRRVKEVTLEAYAHQDVPFEVVVDQLNLERDMSHTPLFQVMFILQNAPIQTSSLSGLMGENFTMKEIDVHSGTSTFDLTFSVAESFDGISLSIEYNTDLFDAATIRRMASHYRQILESGITNPDQSISTLALLREDELQQILVEWNKTYDDFISPEWPGIDRRQLCVHHLFELQVQRTPEAIAVVVPAEGARPRQQLTYFELDERSNQLAAYLLRLGVVPETVIGVCLERSLELIISIMAILKSGAAYLPLDPEAPDERLAFILSDAATIRGAVSTSSVYQPIIITQSHLAKRFSGSGTVKSTKAVFEKDYFAGENVHLILIDTDWDTITVNSNLENLGLEITLPGRNLVDSHNLAYLTYTSGSTGQSKGVMVEHHSLVNAYLAWEKDYDLREASAHLQMANFTFDVFSGDLVRALCSGGKLVLCPREWLLMGERLYQLMYQENIDIAEFVPAVLRNLVQYLEKSGQRLDFMRLLACGSDSWYVSEYRKFRPYLGLETRLINSFGLTEATIDSTFFEGMTDHLSPEQLVPIGRPFANTRLYILDNHYQPRPVGMPGELYVGGPGVARGYNNRPSLQEEKFVQNPFTPENDILYRTGDMARYLVDGNVEFLGRLDDQLKIRGLRIEPGEIEAVLGSHPVVREAAIAAVEVTLDDRRLVGYVVWSQDLEEHMKPSTGDLRRYLQERLPDYMVPSAFVFLDSLPLNASGKVDRRLLAEQHRPDWSERMLASEYIAPRTLTEETLVDVWMQVLGVQQVGVYDNFFELGGHSLLATQLVSRIREVFQLELPLRNLFESPTIATLAEQIEAFQQAPAEIFGKVSTPRLIPLDRDPITGIPIRPVPLSFAQQRLWFLDQLEPDSPFYNIPEVVRMTGNLDDRILEDCLAIVVSRHESLRTTFQVLGDSPVQVIIPAFDFRLPYFEKIDLYNSLEQTSSEREQLALQIAREEAQRPFNLATGPLLRVKLVQISKEDHLVLFTMHHIIGDNWSSNVLISEIAALYDAKIHERSTPLPPLRIQYPDFAAWQREWLQGDALQEQLDYWKQSLSGLPTVLELPTDRPRPAIQTFNGDYRTFSLTPQLSEKVRQMCQAEKVTLFMFLLAAFQSLMSRYSGQEDLAIGSPIANRNLTEIEGLIGFFVNTLVLRGDLSGDPSFKELLGRVRETTLGAFAHQDLPFEMVVDALQPERNLSHSPLFQVMFALQTTPKVGITLPEPGLHIQPIDMHSGTAKFDLTLFMVEDEDHLSGALEFNTDLLDAATIERMIKHFEVLLGEIVQYMEKPVVRLNMLTESERSLILVEWNDTKALFPENDCVHHLFEEQVRRTPDAIAVECPRVRDGLTITEIWSYERLNSTSNALARHLQKLGVGPDILVGVFLDRSPALVVGILGVLKSGGAYVPLDPAYPFERLRYMIEDSGITVLLTQQDLAGNLVKTGDGSDINGITIPGHITVICLDEMFGLSSPAFPDHYQELEHTLFAQDFIENPMSGVDPENLAYVIYTSGSTGRPKGAMIRHRGLMNYLTWCLRSYPVEDGIGSPVHSSISFDLTVTSLFTPLISGKTAFLLPEGLGVETLGDALKTENIIRNQDPGENPFSLVKITPAHLQLLGEQLSPEQAASATKAFIIGGENLTFDHVRFWMNNAPGTVLINEYGPTETVVGCCVYQLPDSASELELRERYPTGIIPIGRPIINTQLYILDAYQQPVPVGVPGELYIGGVGVGRGYLNRPELTAEKFIADPFSQAPGACLYRTGDLARYLLDGNIVCLGRVDFQVKVRGYRVELGEIESLINQYPGVKESVVWVWQQESEPLASAAKVDKDRPKGIDRPNTVGHKNLVGYIVLNESGIQKSSDFSERLREYLRGSLPDYMIPAAFVFLDALPLTNNGKVDRKALPAPDLANLSRSRIEGSVSGILPRTPQEEIIAGIWTQILHIERLTIYDNFFDLGGHSLLATQVISRLRDSFQVELPLRALFESPTIAGLATQVEAARLQSTGLMPPTITRLPRSPETGLPLDLVPLSFSQQRLWVLDQLIPDSPLYNIPAVVSIEGALDLAALDFSLSKIVQRHEALRTIFIQEDGKPYQKVLPVGQEGFELKTLLIDLRDTPESDRQSMAEQLALQEALTPFNLSSGPLLRLVVIQLNDDRFMIVLNTHHIVSDDWSLGIFINELFVYYSIYHKGSSSNRLDQISGIEPFAEDFPAILPELAIQYYDYSAWQRQWLQGSVLDDQLEYWKSQLSDLAPLLELPLDHPRPPVQTYRGSQVTFELSPAQSQAIYAISRREGVTLFMTLLAIFDVLLYRYTGTESFAVGTPIANRTRSEVENLIGFFVNTLVIRADMSGAPGFRDFLRRIRESALGAYAHQDVPFEMLVDTLNPSRDMSYHPLFQVMFILQNAPHEIQRAVSDIQFNMVELHEGIARFDLTLTMIETPSESGNLISGSFEYNCDLFERATVERLAVHFQELIQGVIDDPDQEIVGIPMLSQMERNLILKDWAGSDGKYPQGRCIHELFEEQVAKAPQVPAVIYAEPQDVEIGESIGIIRQLSYGELNDRANRLAQLLRAKGVQPDNLVGICVERSIEMVVAILGVLKAGGAYVPLDPTYPRNRLEHMLVDAQVKILLTQEKLLDRLPVVVGGHDVFLLDRLLVDAQDATPAFTVQAKPENLAYVIYTSGSTGQPKGVMLEHAGLTNLVYQQIQGFGVNAASRVLQFASFSFDACVSEVFMALASGGTLVLTNQKVLGSVMDLLQVMDEQEITTVTLPPSLLRVLDVELVNHALPKFKTLISAGEACPADVGRRWARGRRMFNAYGPTEATIGPTYYEINVDENDVGEARIIDLPEDIETVPIGRPIANMRALLLDPHGQLVPVGVAGEIHLAGVGLARGYLNQAEMTVAKFIPNPYREISADQNELSFRLDKLYCTGDLGRYLPDGNIEYLGRVDQQVKVRGYRIELGEIETVLSQHLKIKSAVVLASGDAGNKRLVAYVLPESGVSDDEIPPDLLRNYLRERLPEYMVPSVFVYIDEIPLTPNGKVDRKALPAPDQIELQLTSVYIEPATEEEIILSGIWMDVLALKPTEDRPTVGVHDNFFELGGDSISAIQVIARANQAGLLLTPRHLFEQPTIAGLANLVKIGETIEVSETLPGTEALLEEPVKPGEISARDLEDFGWSEDDLTDILGAIAKEHGLDDNDSSLTID